MLGSSMNVPALPLAAVLAAPIGSSRTSLDLHLTTGDNGRQPRITLGPAVITVDKQPPAAAPHWLRRSGFDTQAGAPGRPQPVGPVVALAITYGAPTDRHFAGRCSAVRRIARPNPVGTHAPPTEP